MSADNAIGLGVAILAAAYLVVALLAPDRL
ncbi:MAG TPA: K(+)-transporting ATPase subunit F [Acidimicrobiia bacterium]|nr:K(+)-transporting ATPase subunit F [Acidimicrobiia bacterium]